MLNKIFKTVILGFFPLIILTTITSCEKAKDTIGVIIVQDFTGNTVSGASVVLHQDGAIGPLGQGPNDHGEDVLPYTIRKTDITDANGRAEFTYELEAILQVDVEKIEGNDTLRGSNIIRMIKEKTVTQVVEIN
tara:strand:+ start:143 stop:544 length:402 start_codon:yes stop_codon:yes gene_type:complete